jgi:CASPASE and TPR Repeat-associated protein
VTDDSGWPQATSVAEFAGRLRAELDRAELSVRVLAERIAALQDGRRPPGMSYQSLSEFTSKGRRVRLPSDQQLRAILLVCRTEPTRAEHLRTDRSVHAQYGTGVVAGTQRPAPDRPSPASTRVALAEHGIVVHLVVAAGGPSVGACWAHLRATWQRCVEVLGLTSPIRTYPLDLPEDCPAVETGDAFLAARARPAPGVVEMAARRVHDVVCLSLVVAPEDESSWSDIAASWRAVQGEPPDALLGSVVIAQAVLADADAELDVVRLTPEVRQALPVEGALLQRGVLRERDAVTPYVVWEALEDCEDGRAIEPS